MRAEDTCFVNRLPRPEVADYGVLSQGTANRDYLVRSAEREALDCCLTDLLRQLFHMLPDKVVASWMK